jgi:hypothetical protein
MATTAGLSLTNDIMGKLNKNFFIYNLYFLLKMETWLECSLNGSVEYYD